MNKHKYNTSQTKNYTTLFSTVSKTWPSGLERRLKKYGWFSSGRTKQISNPETDHISTPELNHHSIHGRRSRALAQALPTLNGRWNSSSQKHAFTIIEVVLVLAIAGLIFLMVFIALPALQRNQRDAQRKRQVSALHDAYQRCLSLNRGRCRSGAETSREFYERLVNTYIVDRSDITDPSTGEFMTMYQGSYLDIIGDLAAQNLEIGEVGFDWSAGCQSDGLFDDPSDGRINATAAFVIRLESGGIYCVSNYNR